MGREGRSLITHRVKLPVFNALDGAIMIDDREIGLIIPAIDAIRRRSSRTLKTAADYPGLE